MKTQAEKSSDAQVRLHIARQRALGELMIGEHDRPRLSELIVVAVLVGCILFARFKGWM